MTLDQKQIGPIKFWQKGINPRLLIHTGTHGDEWRVIKPTMEYILANTNNLPNFIYVPEVSPSAVANKTRENGNNLDLNRNFLDSSGDEEIKANLEILNNHNFKKIISIHEDPELKERSEFYLYDSGLIKKEEWQKFILKLKEIDIDVLNGFDDPEDPVLGTVFKDGYFSTSHLDFTKSSSGTLAEYLAANNKEARYFTVEVPTQSTNKQKASLVELIFSELVSGIF